MDRLPNELILDVLSYLDHADVVVCQSLDKRFLSLGRDPRIWKERCFSQSPAEAARRRQRLFVDADARLSALRQAMSDISSTQSSGSPETRDAQGAIVLRSRAMANWDPKYPEEELDYYQDYIHRYAPIGPPTWLSTPIDHINRTSFNHEVTGIGVLRDANDDLGHVVGALDDGSVCVWDVSQSDLDKASRTIKMGGRSASGLLTGLSQDPDDGKIASESKTMMTETGSVESVSINPYHKRGLFAIQRRIQEVDLNTLQIISTQSYPFPVTVLSEGQGSTPVTVGTTSTIHLYDSRLASVGSQRDDALRCELIGGPAASHAVLTQPGPLSILNQDQDDSIWVAGRFTHLLNYDRRFFPRLRGTVHSGARISCLSALPYPHIPRDLDMVSNPSVSVSSFQDAKSSQGTTLIAAGVYKGKGSLELYGLSTESPATITSKYQNRQTAATSKLLSAVPHNGTIVTSDSDGNIKWFERNAHHKIRTFNINDTPAPSASTSTSSRPQPGYTTGAESPSFNQASTTAQQQRIGGGGGGLFHDAEGDLPGQGDIVQKIIPFRPLYSSTASASSREVQNPLLLWTGDGRVGVLGFGHRPAVVQVRGALDGRGDVEMRDGGEEVDEGYVSGYSNGSRREEDGLEEDERLRVQARRAERRAREDAERQYAGSLRRALEGQASEARFMRGLGLGGRWGRDG